MSDLEALYHRRALFHDAALWSSLGNLKPGTHSNVDVD